MKQLNIFTLILFCAVTLFSCKQQALTVNPGAVLSKDGTDDGLKNVKEEFKDASRTEEGIKFSLSSDFLFPTNSSYLTDKSKGELSKLAKLLKDNSKTKIRVDGHTDATGTPEYNLWLSDKRAVSVKKFLVDSGISESRITTKGIGQAKPVADNKTPEGRQMNRRVEVVLLNQK
ncbi:OmpA family protein [Sphingobacterium spiritivorum]|uniref:OmpA family protein n=2 Tax=Sphingobacterium spiritivorum TaxID=258 RepID=D7VM50_SPHSI|nr:MULTISPECIES: OmpA family protein [Sphingobacterium]EEI89997.1 OmpA family protein [Sphingobacterium spiritivorum ATCC 33300]EFK58055.1 OmpA family protein [Sphingobacterium spiritivorum ATCC 33861]QQS94979.1 OmpA family protein [Sphingobacterium spiritivorum]QQT34684.1 OmpA family protein [Sphingobacterium spiritivorum]WQD35568.1 OmpA family protein [Sphingobacterium spiritivorum]